MNEELKPCPFCGAHSDAVRAFPRTCNKDTPYDARDRAYPIVRCLGCGASQEGADWTGIETAITKWNYRPTPAPAVAAEHDLIAAINRGGSGEYTPPAAVAVPEGYRLQPHSEFDAMNAFIRGEIKVPPGYALVPVEPTTAILRPFYECQVDELPLAWSAALAIAKAQNKAAPAPATVATEAVAHGGGVDCIGLALDLEKQAKTVESQTTERAMIAAAHGLRLLASAPAVPVAGVLESVREWIDEAPHGNNCFLHDSGEYASCYCGKDSILSYIDSEIEADPASPAATGWLPIETAPKDNAERILLCKDCGPGSLQSYSVGFFIKGWHGAECRGLQTLDDIGYRATHWMPLPDYPPAPSVDGEG